MTTKNSLTYWQNRFLQIEINRDEMDQEYIAEMEDRYKELSDHIREELQEWLDKYAESESLTELLTKQEQSNWRSSLKEYRQKSIAGGYDNELNKAYYRSRITRAQQLERQLYFTLAEQANKEINLLAPHLKEQLHDTYLKNIYELTDQGAFGLNFTRLNAETLDNIIRKPWTASDFSSRIWKHHLDSIPKKLSAALAEGTLKGWGIDKTVNRMMEGVEKNLKNRMVTLVQNESAHIAETASQRAYKETGVKRYRWLATLEVHTCDQCGDLDLKAFVVGAKDALLPIVDTHVNCRCTTAPEIEGWEHRTRWYRDPITGKGVRGPHQSFDEWKKVHVTPEVELQLKKEKNLTSDKKQFNHYKTLIGKGNMPKTFADFQEMKYNDGDKWNQLKRQYRTIGEIERKEWSDDFKARTKQNYYDFLQNGHEFSSHALSRFAQRSDVSVAGASNILSSKPNYVQTDGRKVWFQDGHTFIKNANETEVVTYVYRKNPKKGWERLNETDK